jgi:carbamoyltransferase
MKILGISAHYHDSAAALVVDGLPVCAVQEERLSRHKHDATFPLGAIEWCLDHADLDPADLDAVVFYERSMRKFDRILTSALRTFPRSWRAFPHAIKNSLGDKVGARGRLLHRADPARGDPDRRRRRRMGHAHRRPRRAAARRRRAHHAAA